MKFFSASIFLLLGSALLGESLVITNQILGGLDLNLGSILEGGGIVNNVLGGVQETVGHVSKLVSDVLNKLPTVVPSVISTVQKLINGTGKVLTSKVGDLVDNLLQFNTKVGDCKITINVDPKTLKVTIENFYIGNVMKDGSIKSLKGEIIGFLDKATRVLVVAGPTVDEVLRHLGTLHCKGIELTNKTESADNVVDGILKALKTALPKLTKKLKVSLGELPKLTVDAVTLVNKLIKNVDQALVFTLKNVSGRVLEFSGVESGKRDVTLKVNLDNLLVTANSKLIGAISKDGAIRDTRGNIIGFIDQKTGVLLIFGKTVDTILKSVTGILSSLLNGILG